MKAFELTMKLKNNLIKRRRLELGLTPRQAAKNSGVSYSLWLGFEALTETPLAGERSRKRGAIWKPTAQKIASFLGIPLGELFPDAVLAVTDPVLVHEIDADQLLSLSGLNEQLLLDSSVPMPDVYAESEELRRVMKQSMSVLTPREEMVIKGRFEDDRTLEEIGEEFGVGRDRIRQIEAKALRKLRAPRVIRTIREAGFLE